jgi:DnaJ-class molecular chaperone
MYHHKPIIAATETCTACNGTGYVMEQRNKWEAIHRLCKACGGNGFINKLIEHGK